MVEKKESFEYHIRGLKQINDEKNKKIRSLEKDNELLRYELDVFKASDKIDKSLFVLCQYEDNREGGETVYVIGVFTTEKKMKEAKLSTYKLCLENSSHSYFTEDSYPDYLIEGMKNCQVIINEEEMYGTIFSEYVGIYEEKNKDELKKESNVINCTLDKIYLDHLE